MSTALNPLASSLPPTQDPASAAQNGGTNSTPDSGLANVANMNTFLQLLVAQIKNQNPLDPTDSTQFVSQLAQFSELEQMIGVRSNTQAIQQELEQALAAAPAPGNAPAGGQA